VTDVIIRIVGIEGEGHTATGPETGQIPQIRQTSGGEFLIKTAAKVLLIGKEASFLPMVTETDMEAENH